MAQAETTRFWVGASTVGALGSAARGIRPLDIAADGAALFGDAGRRRPEPDVPRRLRRDRRARHRARARPTGRSRPGRSRATHSGPSALAGATDAADPCHLAFDESGAWLFAANYTGGRLTAHQVAPDVAADAAHSVAFTGSGPNRERQASPHAHQAVVDAARGRLLVADLGADRVRVIGLDGLPAVAPPRRRRRHRRSTPAPDRVTS